MLSILSLLLLTTPVPQDMWLDVSDEIDKQLSWTAALKIENSCYTESSPLTFVYEYNHRNDGMRSVCAQRPWRSSSWLIDECDSKCSEYTDKILP